MAGKPNARREREIDRSEILRTVVADAESMGLRDREKIERLTALVIERLEKPRALPGMEYLVAPSRTKPRGLPTSSEIQAILQEILEEEKPRAKKEVRPMREPSIPVKQEVVAAHPVNLGDNALRVLEHRYLEKDKDGRVVETPEELFRRVAKDHVLLEPVHHLEVRVIPVPYPPHCSRLFSCV